MGYRSTDKLKKLIEDLRNTKDPEIPKMKSQNMLSETIEGKIPHLKREVVNKFFGKTPQSVSDDSILDIFMGLQYVYPSIFGKPYLITDEELDRNKTKDDDQFKRFLEVYCENTFRSNVRNRTSTSTSVQDQTFSKETTGIDQRANSEKVKAVLKVINRFLAVYVKEKDDQKRKSGLHRLHKIIKEVPDSKPKKNKNANRNLDNIDLSKIMIGEGIDEIDNLIDDDPYIAKQIMIMNCEFLLDDLNNKNE